MSLQARGNQVDNLIDDLVAGSMWWLNALGNKYGFLSKEFDEALRLTRDAVTDLVSTDSEANTNLSKESR